MLPLTRQIAVRGMQFAEAYPDNLAGRQFGATALLHGSELVTADQGNRASGEVATIR